MLTRPSETGLPDPARDAGRGVHLPVDDRVNSLFGRFARLADLSERKGWAYFLLIPSLLMVGAVVVYPVTSGILLSFRQMQINRPRLGEPWVGLDQYRRLWEDDVFRTAAGNTVYWVVGGATSQFL